MMLVTGGTHGIGRACVERLARDGHRVMFVGRDREAGEALQRSIASATYFPCDVAIEADCRRAIDAALRLSKGRLDGLVNNAGMTSRSNFAESDAAEWDQVMAVNVRSAFLFTRYALDALIAAKGANISIRMAPIALPPRSSSSRDPPRIKAI